MSQQAEDEFTKFVTKEVADPSRLAPLLIHQTGDIRKELLSQYIEYLTGDSLQSVAQVRKVARALGLDAEPWVRERVEKGKDLDDLFRARNAIVHELDLTPDERWDRRYRTLKDTRRISGEALVVSQRFINAVGTKIKSA